ncbi:MAG: hypothetical protein ACTHNB_14175 [Gaiellaceae bacterium]
MTRRIAHAAQIGALVLALVVVPAALAARGGGKPGGSGATGSSTVSEPVLVTDTGTPGLSRGDTVTFNVSTPATQPYIHLVCGGGGVGYDSWKGVFPGSLDTNWNFILSSGGWTSGAADCTASLGTYTKHGFQTLASTSFHVDA